MRSHFLRAASPKGGGGGWTPDDITTDLWLDAADASSITLNGSNVSEWADKSGNGRHLEQGTAGNQPLYANQINGQNVVTFADDYLMTAANTALPVKRSCMFCVFRTTGTGEYMGVLILAPTSGNDYDSVNAAAYETGVGGTTTMAWPNTPGYAAPIECGVKPVAFGLYRNRRTLGDSTTNTGKVIVGARYLNGAVNTANYLLVGDMGELIYAPHDMSTGDYEKTEGYLAHKWGLEANLPSGHPYKSSPP